MALLEPGRRIGPYEVVAPLRSGGMAALYLGRRVGPAGFAKPVAIKVVHEHLARSHDFTQMFLDEARLASRISDPRVVHVEALGEDEGMFYIVMEYVPGTSLALLLDRVRLVGRRLAPEVACAIAVQVADGLHAAHELEDADGEKLQVVHRDVSPQNILISRSGHVKLIDFGVARWREQERDTGEGTLKGKLSYMAPEQAWGRYVDRRVDVYALGVVLWEMLALRPLFNGESDLETLDLVRDPGPITPPSELAPGIPAAIDEVVLRALRSDAAERFASAKEMRIAIADAVPEALRVHSDDLSALVHSFMQEELEEERRLLRTAGQARSERERVLEDVETTVARLTPRAAQDDVGTLASTPSSIREEDDDEPPPASPAPFDSVPSTRASSAPTAAPPAPSRAPAVAVAFAITAAVLGTLFGLWAMEPDEAAEADPRSPPDAAPPPAPVGCEAARRIVGVEGETSAVAEDTHDLGAPFALSEARNEAVGRAPQLVVEYVVPGEGQRALELSTANPGTDPLFDTLIGVFHGACEDEMLERVPEIALDDHRFDFRASGSVAVEGGETLTLVVTGFGGALSRRRDRGLVRLEMAAPPASPPTLERATIVAADAQLFLDLVGEDVDGDAEGVDVRLHDEGGAILRVAEHEDGPRGSRRRYELREDAEVAEGADAPAHEWVQAGLLRPVDGRPMFEERAIVVLRNEDVEAVRRAARATVRVYDAAGYRSGELELEVSHGTVVGPEEPCGDLRVCAEELTCGGRGVCSPVPAAVATCRDALPIELQEAEGGALEGTVESNVVPGRGLFAAQCLRRWTRGAEDVYRLAVPSGSWRLEMSTDDTERHGGSPLNPDTVLYLRRECLDSRPASAPDAWCNDDIQPGGAEGANQRSAVVLDEVTEGTIYVFVEVWGNALPGSDGERYELAVTLTPVTP